MTNLFGVYCTDEVARDNSHIAISALDDMIWMGSDGGRPLGISHDWHRFIGWNMITGLYMSHERSYVVGNSYIPDSQEEYETLRHRRDTFWRSMMQDSFEKSKKKFQKVLKKADLLSNIGKWHFNGLALYGYENILFKAFPQLRENYADGMILLEKLMKDFKYLGQGVLASKYNDLAILLHPYFRRSFSIFNNFNFGFINKLFEVYESGNHSVQVALDTSFIGFAPSFVQCHEYEYWFGPQYNDDIGSIREGVCKYQNNPQDKVYNNVDFTEFVWQKKENGTYYQFEMEEVVDRVAPTLGDDTYACRYLHAFYDFNKNEFNHFDGAIRTYDYDRIVDRLDKPINQAGHNADYTKIFRMDGRISIDLWKGLITQYLCSNRSVYEYFGEPFPFLETPKATKEKNIHNYVPYILNEGDGIRLCVAYGNEYTSQKDWSYQCFDVIDLEDGKHNVIELPTVEVTKILKRTGVDINVPKDKEMLIVEDYCNNIPLIFHKTGKDLNVRLRKTLDGLRLLIGQHVKNKDKDVYSFALAWNLDGRSITLSFMGHVADLNDWLNSFEEIPVDRKRLKMWLETQNKYIHTHGKDSRHPINDTHIQSDGILFFQRRSIQKDVIINNIVGNTNEGFTANIEVKDNTSPIISLLEKGELQIAMSMRVLAATEIETGMDYLSSSNSAIFGECHYCVEPKMLGFFWASEVRPIHWSEKSDSMFE